MSTYIGNVNRAMQRIYDLAVDAIMQKNKAQGLKNLKRLKDGVSSVAYAIKQIK